MSDKVAIISPGSLSHTDTDNPPEDFDSRAHWLAELHRRQSDKKRTSQSGRPRKGQDIPELTTLLSDSLPRLSLILKEGSSRFQAQTSKAGKLSSAAEWLLDNYHLAAQTIREVQQDLPPHYERELPRLQTGHPRIYQLAAEIIQIEDALLDLGRVQRFIQLYQDVIPLTMGELWALPIMLRLVILSYLSHAVARLTDINAGADSTSPPVLKYPDQLKDELIVENCIRSLRQLSISDWKPIFESVSLVEQTLRHDPAGLYVGMNFETRDLYRKAVEEVADFGQNDELSVAQAAVHLARVALDQAAHPSEQVYSDTNLNPEQLHARAGWDDFSSQPEAHVGFYLLGQGRRDLDKACGYSLHGSHQFTHTFRNRPTPFYLASIALITLILMLIPLSYLTMLAAPLPAMLLVSLLTLIPAVTVAVELVNWAVIQLFRPSTLPGMDFSDSIPDECATMVVIPALLSGKDEVDSLVDQLEQHYLRNSDPALYFALVTDFTDAHQENLPSDDELVEHAKTRIRSLNEKYRQKWSDGTAGDHFALLHRERKWNPSEGVWMGWERKRGKLHDLNRTILSARDMSRGNISQDVPVSFPIREGDLSYLERIRYVITLDADTILPRDAAQELIAILAHPENRARFVPVDNDVCGEEVSSGYSILQPRTDINPTSGSISSFARIFSGDTGLDLYTRAVSDIYQDIFDEGNYVGKGIYDVESFERSLQNCIPENTLLSHDLLEGIHARAALVTSVALIEDIPAHYLVHSRRLHRWIRGDWQLLPWLFSPRLSAISRWKIIDNLRRSLLAPALLILILAGWLILPGHPAFWTLAGSLTIAVPVFTGFLAALRRSLSSQPARQVQASLRNNFFRWLLALVFLPHEAQLALDAILKTLVRLTITRRGMLRWTASAQVARRYEKLDALMTLREMAFSPFLAITVAAFLYLFKPTSLPWAAPLLLAWFLAPFIAAWVSRPLTRREEKLDLAQTRSLRQLARRTWLFFEQFIGPEDQWLPPDHFQEAPLGIVAHRTSPTNIGLGLLSALGAYDLGYLDPLTLTTRLNSTLDTLDKLERYRGHFLNWYDTRSLEPLQPRYVSMVDSGNLAACLLVLREACLEIPNRPVLRWNSFEGLLDSIGLLDGVFLDLTGTSYRPVIQEIRAYLSSIIDVTQSLINKPDQWVNLLSDLRGCGTGQTTKLSWDEIDRLILGLVDKHAQELHPEKLRSLRYYNRAVRQQLNSIQRSIDLLLPWPESFQTVPAVFRNRDLPPELRVAWQQLITAFPSQPALMEISAACRAGRLAVSNFKDSIKDQRGADWEDARHWALELESKMVADGMTAEILVIGFESMARRCEAFFQSMDFSFLYDSHRQVFHIGYNISSGGLDLNYYDLLASEARIGSLVAIAKGDVPQKHWLHLSRPFTIFDGRQALVSWSATMFEYLMPRLVLPAEPGTLLGETLMTITDRQIDYGREKNIPWGISESGYYRFDANQFYQYRAFGVPGLGYKRGLADDLVVTPYASLLALPVRPRAVLQNMERLTRLGMLGMYGFYEAIDFTSTRLEMGKENAIVQSYMAHHQGMIMLSLVNYLQADVMVQRFQRDQRIQSVNLLLLEQIPRDAPIEQLNTDGSVGLRVVQRRNIATPWRVDPRAPQPRAHYLSNGRYSTLITAAGGGYSTWQDIDLTRWRSDTTRDNWGTWIYVKDQESGTLWSTTLQPTLVDGEEHEVFFNNHAAEFRRRDGHLAQITQVFVAPVDDVEIRLITLTNHENRPRRLSLTSYGEVILTSQSNDVRHPAFNKMFIENEPLPRGNGVLFHRRPRSDSETEIFMAHAVVSSQGEKTIVRPTIETDRARFLGRNRTLKDPALLQADSPVSPGHSIDPIFSITQPIHLPPHGSTRIAFITTAAHSADDARSTIAKYSSISDIQSAFERARILSEEEMSEQDISSEQLKDIQTLLSSLLFPSRFLRTTSDRLSANRKSQPGLWPFAISGDYPILLLKIESEMELNLARELLQAHIYWRNRRLMIDLVILDMQNSTYNQELTSKLYRMITSMESELWLNRRGGIFLLHGDQMEEADRILLESAARVVLDKAQVSLSDYLQHLPELDIRPSRLPAFSPTLPQGVEQQETDFLTRPQDLIYDNGFGGFSQDGTEYCIYLEPGKLTPAPWTNVIANPHFGFLTTESGLGTSWSENSGENRLSPWRNDPVSNQPSEAVYLRDEETGIVWTPTPLPSPASAPYLTRHGAGYTIYEHISNGLHQHLQVFTPPDSPLKILHVQLKNTWDRPRRITATYYVELVLGTSREISQQYLIPEYNSDPQAILVRNPFNTEFSERVAFISASNPLHGLTTDRTEFLGRLGNLEQPAALTRIGLASTVEPGIDPCAALQLHIDMLPGATEQVYFILGQAENRQAALELVRQYNDIQQIESAWESNKQFWDATLNTVQVHTPEPSLDLLLNRWLLYQTLACRLWGRTAFYQSSGAYGFRDQLQDIMALLHAAPHLAREHILRAAWHQFEAGDVLHWWHPPSGRGIRSRISDNLLWLPFVTAEYVTVTGDDSILSEKIPFRHAPLLERGQNERYGEYPVTSAMYSLFEHCRRALEKGTTSGMHNLPLIGSGDWNDGMSRVGIEGRGESVWLAWFLYNTLNRFADLCERRGQDEPAAGYRQRAADLAEAIEQSAWDGEWYIRAFYDNGFPLGSSENQECQIDSIAQSWSLLSGAGDPQRAARAMQSVADHLIRRRERLLLLFAPPFNKTNRDPGYIRGYPPGIRENGGQYTHAAVWSVWAFLELGRIEEGFEFFQFLNPILHADDIEKAAHYRVEPYVIAADVYGAPPYTGQGGWTWYTGSASWMYRLGLEGIIGLKKSGDFLEINPRIPKAWAEFTITYRHGKTDYQIQVLNPTHVNQGVTQVSMNGQDLADKKIPLSSDGGTQQVTVTLG